MSFSILAIFPPIHNSSKAIVSQSYGISIEGFLMSSTFVNNNDTTNSVKVTLKSSASSSDAEKEPLGGLAQACQVGSVF